MPCFNVMYGEGDGGRITGWNCPWVMLGPIGYNANPDWP